MGILGGVRMNWYKKATRGRYPGQMQGDEHRPGFSSFEERLMDNDLLEGEFERTLKQMIKDKRWDAVTQYTQEMAQKGFSKDRIDSILTRAMHGVKL